jgi:rhamnosyltransferase
MLRILVLLATYNGSRWIREQLTSILSQEDVEVQVLVADDVSSDGTFRMIEEGWQDDPRVKVHAWEQGSGSAGANFRRLYVHADMRDFDFVALADQDDIWLPRKLISAIDSLRQTGAHGYSCSVRAFWPDGRENILDQNSELQVADFLFEGAGQGCTFVLRQESFVRIQQFCRDHPVEVAALHYHDWLIYLLLRTWGLQWYFDSRVWMRYRQHGGNEIGARGGLKAITRRLERIRDGWYLQQIQAAARLYALAGGQDGRVRQISTVLLEPARGSGFQRRFKISLLLLCHGRRRLSERLVLFAAALAGTF